MNNFEKMKAQFLKETGLDAKQHIDTYIAYYQAKMIEYLVQGYYTKNNLKLNA